ncbi:MAG: hypothetical protein EXX96DRAFT_558862 [Benjaminiella poitrasii]|nr:MAG: hypothetical protein EXX96DRAFT_558862 [Benjaminiella poitrasii]
MFMQHNKTKRSKINENDVDDSPSLSKGIKEANSSNAKSLSEAINRTSDNLALKLKSNNQKASPTKNTNEKQKHFNIPLKRSKSATSLLHQPETKKQHIQGVERTHRHHEEELEWSPAGVDLDFSPFSNEIDEASYFAKKPLFQDDIEQVLETGESAHLMETVEDMTEKTLINSTAEETLQFTEDEEDLTKVEYGPPKEKELDYLPDETCIIDVSSFDHYVELSAYEFVRYLYDEVDIDDFDQEDADLLAIAPIDDDSLEFPFEISQETVDTEDDFSCIPFQEHKFDVDHFIQCN